MTVSPPPSDEVEPRSGTGLRVCALIAGLAALLCAYPALRFWAKFQQTQCSSRLRDVHIGAEQYLGKHGSYPYADGDWEATVDLLQVNGCLSYRPKCARHGEGGFEGFLKPYGKGIPADTPVAWDKDPHGSNGRVVRFADQSVRYVGEAEFRELLAAHGLPPETPK